MWQKYNFLLFGLLILTGQSIAVADDIQAEKQYLITDISISGLKRTKKHVAEKSLKKFIGQNAASIDFKEIRIAIIETGILEPVSIDIEDDGLREGKILKVEVHEKWTILPLPIFFANSSGIGGGLAFMDFNALGLNDKFIFGGMIDSDGWLAATTYIHTPGRTEFPGWNIAFVYSRQDNSDSDEKGNDIRRYGLKKLFVSMGLNYHLKEIIVPSFNVTFDDEKIHDIDNPLSVPKEDGCVITLSPGLLIKKNDWDGFFLSQKSIKLGYSYSFGIDSPSFQEIEVETKFEKSLIPGFRLISNAGVVYAPDAPPLFESAPRSVNVNILPQSFSAQNFIGASAGFEKYIFKAKYGTLSALAAYQIVYSDGPILEERVDHGVFGSIQFYLSRIAIPAVGLGISYNVAAEYLQGSFNIGMSF